ncbi:hypothetical protein CJ739_1639 [Mariniflexile rhizosphaerae]|nr:hypothetical protein CJ739_1639 [Mariniflexile sp. TRM1-10]
MVFVWIIIFKQSWFILPNSKFYATFSMLLKVVLFEIPSLKHLRSHYESMKIEVRVT